ATLHEGNCDPPIEASAAVADIEVDTPFAAGCHRGAGFAGGGILLAAQSGIHVGVNVAGAEDAREKVVKGAFLAIGAVVDHDGDLCKVAGDDRLLVRLPLGALEMSTLDTND